MVREALREVRNEVPPFTGPALLAGVVATAALVVVMVISASAGVAAGLVVFSFFLLALGAIPACAAWQEGTVWREGASGRKLTAVQALHVGAALALLVCAAASMVWAFGADLIAAAVAFVLCVGGLALLAHHFRDAHWLDQTRRAYAHVGWPPKLILAAVWLIALAPEAISAYGHEEIREGRVWEPAILTIVAILPLGWFLWDSGVLRTRQADERPAPEPHSAR